ncbi:MAG TPA: hypothetical protein VGB83_08555 [Actinomycetota bacterium]
MRRVLIGAAALVLATTLAPAGATPLPQRDLDEMLAANAQRYVPKAAGTYEKMSLMFGPYSIPPGQDSNRITVDLPAGMDGYITAVAPDLVDATTGRIPTEQEAHIHHAHWFRVDTTGEHEPYTAAGPASLSWVFGTGEEKSQGRFEDRWDMGADEPFYGMRVDSDVAQVLIYMIHNKTPNVLNTFVVLDIEFMHGTKEAIEASPLNTDGRQMHGMEGTLWGETRDADASYPMLMQSYKAPVDGTIVASGGHMHPGGKKVVLANLGQNGSCRADLDGDGFPGTTILNSYKYDRIVGAYVYSEDYQQGTTKFGWRAPLHKDDVLVQYAPYSIYAGGAPSALPSKLDDGTNPNEKITQAEWDAILAEDPGAFTSVDGKDHSWYEAMSYQGIYVDRAQAPATSNACAASSFAPDLLGPDTFAAQSEAGIVNNTRGQVLFVDPEMAEEDQALLDAIEARFKVGTTEGMINHAWVGPADRLCGVVKDAFGPDLEWDAEFANACALPDAWATDGDVVDTIHVANFLYLPGDISLQSAMGLPKVQQGTTLTLVNDDAAMNVRHTFTSCALPCNGGYVSNYPLPDGEFDTDKMGNVDPIDGGFSGDWQPIYELDTAGLDPAVYSYYCRIHPSMRGAFEVVA